MFASRRLRVICAIVALGVGAIGCGSSHDAMRESSSTQPGVVNATQSAPASARLAPRSARLKGDEDDDDTPANLTPGDTSKDNDADGDNDYKKENGGYLDGDDRSMTAYGHAASEADRRAISQLVERYYGAAATKDGAAGCAMIYSSFAASVPEDWGQSPGPAYSRGKTCAVVMSKIFAHYHAQMSSPIRVTAVRVEGDEGRALVGSPLTPAVAIFVRREHGDWKINQLIGEKLP
jgi:hypothetical protein